MNPELSVEEIARYARNMVLAEVGREGQERLKGSRALVIGAGGLGSPALYYLAAAGVGAIEVVDDDGVEFSNLQRQILYRAADVGRAKVEAARDALGALNDNCRILTHAARADAGNIRGLVRGHDVVLDASDNFPTRFLVSDGCWLEGVPLVFGAAIGFAGQLMVIKSGDGNPCYRCLVPEMPPAETARNCREGGVLGAVTGVVGSLMAVEAVKILTGRDPELARRMVHYDALTCRFVTMDRVRDPRCRLCGDEASIKEVELVEETRCNDG